MRAVILAAGYATRLYPLTKDTPKCLLEVGGRSILDRIVDKVTALGGAEEIVIVTNAKFYGKLKEWVAKQGTDLDPGSDPESRSVPITVLNDGTTSNENRLGAIGDLQFAIDKRRITGELLLLASDNLFDQGLAGFVAFARSKQSAVCMALHDIGDPKLAAGKYGVIEIHPSGEVFRMEEKPMEPRAGTIGMGVYYFPKTALPLVKRYLSSGKAGDAPGFFMKWLVGKTDLFGYPLKGMWYDIGDLNALEEARKRI